MIMRRFSSQGDVERAWQYVLEVRPFPCIYTLHIISQSDGVANTS